MPPPKQAPVRAATTGFALPSSRAARSVRVGLEAVTPPLVPSAANSRMSAPALNAPRPSGRPTRTTAATEGSARARPRDFSM